MLHMGAYTVWADYAGGQLSLAAVEEKEAEAELAWACAQAAVAAKAEKSVAAQKAAAASDPAVRDATALVLHSYALRKVLEAVHAGLEAKARVVSRDLTRRTGARDVENRSARYVT